MKNHRGVILNILLLFLIWRITLFLAAYLAVFFIPDFGSRFPYYNNLLEPSGLPNWIWGFGNFDGVHYIRIALLGYEGSQFSQAFFPLYPLLINILSSQKIYLLSGLLISNLFFLVSLYIFYSLLKIDYKKVISYKTLLLLVAFPTSFYFGALYSESLFFFFTVSCIYLLRNKQFLGAGLFGGLASGTRVLGLMLIPVFLIELFLLVKSGEIKIKSEEFVKGLLGVFLVPLGTLLYIHYLNIQFYNPFYFLTSQPAFGAQRSSQIVLLPQVIFRYIKIFLTVPINSLTFFNAFLEFIFTLLPFLILILAYKKIRFSYWIFTLGCLIIPTLTGTLSSMPRYALMSFLIFPFIAQKSGQIFKWILAGMVILGLILTALFTRGYWVA